MFRLDRAEKEKDALKQQEDLVSLRQQQNVNFTKAQDAEGVKEFYYGIAKQNYNKTTSGGHRYFKK